MMKDDWRPNKCCCSIGQTLSVGIRWRSSFRLKYSSTIQNQNTIMIGDIEGEAEEKAAE